jgi:ribosome-associated protein
MGLRVSRSLEIPEHELELKFTPSGGPGGQHANRSATRVEIVWNVADSSALGPRQRARLLDRLGHRIDSSGYVRVRSDRFRSQTRNRADALERLAELVRESLRAPRDRRPTKPTRASKDERVRRKKRRAETKRLRRPPRAEDY